MFPEPRGRLGFRQKRSILAHRGLPKVAAIYGNFFTGTFVGVEASYDGEVHRGAPDFQGLVDLHYEPLYRFAVSLTHAEADAGDLVQETFLTWAAKGSQLRDLSKAKSWLFTTLHRRFLEGQRRVVRFPHLDIAELEAELPGIEPAQATQLDSLEVVELLAKVDPQFRGAVALFYLEDYSYNEIAAILEVPLGTVKSRIARGLARLKELVADPSRTPGPNSEEVA